MIPIVSSKLHSKTFQDHVCKVKCSIIRQMFKLDEEFYKKCLNDCYKNNTNNTT